MSAIDSVPLWPFRIFRILLVEDLLINQEITRKTLEAVGHHVDVASDGAAAIEAFRINAYDIVLMDIQMPGVDGLAATRMIRALEGAIRRVPIVALTSCTDPSDLARFKPCGIDGYLSKPYTNYNLHWIVEYWVSGGATPSIATNDKTATSPLDQAVFKELENLIGSDKIKRLLQILEFSFRETIPLAPVDEHESVIARSSLHNLVSQAGQIGFRDLSNAARELGTAIAGGSPDKITIANFENARNAARNEIDRRIVS